MGFKTWLNKNEFIGLYLRSRDLMSSVTSLQENLNELDINNKNNKPEYDKIIKYRKILNNKLTKEMLLRIDQLSKEFYSNSSLRTPTKGLKYDKETITQTYNTIITMLNNLNSSQELINK